jgi:Uma2 family endonuclease
MASKTQATIEDLAHVPDYGKAELVNGELVFMCPTGGIPGYADGEIFVGLRDYAQRTKTGYAFPDNVGFLVNLPNRRSLSPNAAFYTGALPGGQFLAGAPLFAAEVRSEGDFGPQAELEMADKRADYFAAGTQVVWDVDSLRSQEIRKYSAGHPEHPVVFHRGELADAEPALPGWWFAVDDLFP